MSRFFETISETSYAIIYGDVKHFDSLVEPQIDLESEDLRWISLFLDSLEVQKLAVPLF